MFVIALSAVILRGFGKYSRSQSRHTRCHGIDKGRLATFQESWDRIPNKAACLILEEASGVGRGIQTTSYGTLGRSCVADRPETPYQSPVDYVASASRDDITAILNRRWITEKLGQYQCT